MTLPLTTSGVCVPPGLPATITVGPLKERQFELAAQGRSAGVFPFSLVEKSNLSVHAPFLLHVEVVSSEVFPLISTCP